MIDTEEHTTNEQDKTTKTLFRIPINGCLTTILLCALCIIGINECKRSSLRLKQEQIKHQKFMDSIDSQRQDSATFVLNQTLQMEK